MNHRLLFCLFAFSLFFVSSLAEGKQGKWFLHDVSLGGVVGSWGGVTTAGLRGAFPLGRQLSLRIGWTLSFGAIENIQLSYNRISIDLLIRLPSPIDSIRYYALTRIDFWPLWDAFGVNPKLTTISSRPTFGFSMLFGMESFLLTGFSLFMESGFSSGMLIGFAPIEPKFQSFGFVIQSGMQLYF